MDLESPDEEKAAPGPFTSVEGQKANESDVSDGGDHNKSGKKDLLGRRKEKKDKGYATLDGDSSPEDAVDTKSPSIFKKSKSFKFPTKGKEKREKSRDKNMEKGVEDAAEGQSDKHKKKHKDKKETYKDKDEKSKLDSKEKLKDEKKVKVQEKAKIKEKKKLQNAEKEKSTEKDREKIDSKPNKVPSALTSGIPFEEIFTLGVAQPIFGVPLQQSIEWSRCHDDTGLPLVVRDSIDYLQENGLKSRQIYRAEADKIKVQQLRKLYTDRCATFPYHWDIPVACAILKSYISELPDSILTRDLHGHFEQAAVIAEPHREKTMLTLIAKLPPCNCSLLAWLMRHFKSVVDNAQDNLMDIEGITTAMGPTLNMSHTLLNYLITNAEKFFPGIVLEKYVPPLLMISADFPTTANEINTELRKQESLLNQIHAEMHAGFITELRDQQLWEAQRIVTQLKRKLRVFQKSESNVLPQASIPIEKKPSEDASSVCSVSMPDDTLEAPVSPPEPSAVLTPSTTTDLTPDANHTKASPKSIDPSFDTEFTEYQQAPGDFKSLPAEFKVKPKLSEKEMTLLRLQLEKAEYLQLKALIQAKINSEHLEIVKLRSQLALKTKPDIISQNCNEVFGLPEEQESRKILIENNATLERKRLFLINQIFYEQIAYLKFKIELAMKEILWKS